jgi:hypothetical protein
MRRGSLHFNKQRQTHMTQLLTDLDTDGASEVLAVQAQHRSSPRYVRVVIAGTATVKLQGRMSSDDTWFDIDEAFTASGFVTAWLPPQVRFDVADTEDAIVNAWIDATA